MGQSIFLIGGFLIGLLVVVTFIIMRNFHVVSTNEMLIKQGLFCGENGRRVSAITGQLGIILPLVQKGHKLTLTPWDIHVVIEHVYAQEFIPLGIKAYCQVALGTDNISLENAGQHLVDKSESEIVSNVKRLLEGVVRSTMAMMDPMKAMTDKESFSALVTKNSRKVLQDLGLKIIGNLSIQTVEDPPSLKDGFIAQLERREQNKASMNKEIANSNAQTEATVSAENFRQLQRVKQIQEEITSFQKEMEYKINKVIGNGENMANQVRAENRAELGKVKAAVETAKTELEAAEQRLEAMVITPALARREVLLAEGEKDAIKVEKEEMAQIELLEKKLSIVNASGPEGIKRFILENIERLTDPITRTMQGTNVGKISLIDSSSNSLVPQLASLLQVLPNGSRQLLQRFTEQEDDVYDTKEGNDAAKA